ncbi:hypothetical protein HPB52_010698 [Rhipicephalus sanguineus]|uniref:Peptidase M13 N-terminal domain-containing protein n=1 Tax=Rhipicephalus sanguineus TaxID=34632 RepID=A0A9D4PZF9_RHISA|nr:hypothetical protein HPB52_010698 [Rhipicephalus sanguineus]
MDRRQVRLQSRLREEKQGRSTAQSSLLDSFHSTESKPPAKPTVAEQGRARNDKLPESGYSTPSEGLTFSTTLFAGARIRPGAPGDVCSPQNFCLSSRVIHAAGQPAPKTKDVRSFKYETAPEATGTPSTRRERPNQEDAEQISGDEDLRELPAGAADMFEAISKLVAQFVGSGDQGATPKENVGTAGEVSPPKTENESRATPRPVARSTRPVVRSSAVTRQKNDSLAVDSVADIDLRVVSREGEPDSKEYLVAFVLLAIFVVFLFVVFYVFALAHGRNKAGSHTTLACVSDYCVKDAEYLGRLLSWKDDPPCDNFYMFVCRRWKSQYLEAPPSSFVSQDDDNIASLEQGVYAMLQNKAENSKSLSWLRDVMDKCMDEKQIEGDGWDSLLELMSDASVGPFPMTPPVRRSLSAWKSAGRLLRKTGTTTLFALTVAVAPSGSPNSVLAFLSAVFYDRWPAYTDKLASDVLVLSPDIVRRIIQLVESTELHTAINYLALRLMIQVSPFIPHADLTQVFGTFLTGRPMMISPRWKICLRAVEKALAPLMYASYFTYQNLHASASHKTHFRVLGPPWVSDGAAMEAYVQTLPTIYPAHTALQSYTGVYEATFLYSLSRGFSQQWTRSMFSTECWHELNPRTLYVPLLTFNVTLWSHPNTQSLQVSRAGFRVQECILEMLLGHTAFANDQSQWWLDEATKHKLESSEACLDRIAGRGNVREPLGIVKRSLSVRLACEQYQRSVNASGRKLTLNLPNSEWNAALGNDPELSAAFGCPHGSAMNPARKCGG